MTTFWVLFVGAGCGGEESLSQDSRVLDASLDGTSTADAASDAPLAELGVDSQLVDSTLLASDARRDATVNFQDVRILETGTRDAAPRPMLVDTDTLQVSPQTLSLARGAKRCLSVSLVHENGSVSPFDGSDATVVSRNTSIAVATTTSDCVGVGVLALHEGTTTAEVTLREGDIVLRAVVRVSVGSAEISLALTDPFGAVVGETTEVPIFATGTQGSVFPSPTLVRGLRADPDIADLAIGHPLESGVPPGFVLSLTGRAAGATELYLTYGLPGEEREIHIGSANILPASSEVRVVGLTFGHSRVFSSDGIDLLLDSGDTWVPPGCYPVHARLLHQETRNSPAAFTRDPEATLSSSTAGVTISQGSPPTICMADAARLDLRVCARGVCGDVVAVVGDPSSVASVRVSNANIDIPVPAGASTSECSGCVPLEATATMRDGSIRDITGSRTASVNGWPGSVYLRPSDRPGSLCFDVSRAPTPAFYNYGRARAEMTVRCVRP